MTPEAAKTLVSNYIESVWNRAELAALEDLCAPSFTYRLGGQPPRDRPAMEKFLEAVHVAFPDWRVEIGRLVAEGDWVVAQWQGRGTHEGVFQGIPPTGKRVSVSGVNVYTIEDGKIGREWEQMDSLGLLQQLGALPAPEPQTDE